jgi:phosphoribosylglycinamide formyltransferase
MASGFGSNFQAIIDCVASGKIPNSQIVSLFTNRNKAHAIKRAEEAGNVVPCSPGVMVVARF